jgi:hypothetical protein
MSLIIIPDLKISFTSYLWAALFNQKPALRQVRVPKTRFIQPVKSPLGALSPFGCEIPHSGTRPQGDIATKGL